MPRATTTMPNDVVASPLATPPQQQERSRSSPSSRLKQLFGPSSTSKRKEQSRDGSNGNGAVEEARGKDIEPFLSSAAEEEAGPSTPLPATPTTSRRPLPPPRLVSAFALVASPQRRRASKKTQLELLSQQQPLERLPPVDEERVLVQPVAAALAATTTMTTTPSPSSSSSTLLPSLVVVLASLFQLVFITFLGSIFAIYTAAALLCGGGEGRPCSAQQGQKQQQQQRLLPGSSPAASLVLLKRGDSRTGTTDGCSPSSSSSLRVCCPNCGGAMSWDSDGERAEAEGDSPPLARCTCAPVEAKNESENDDENNAARRRPSLLSVSPSTSIELDDAGPSAVGLSPFSRR